ncbi:MAG: hypothetical protein PHP88_06305 [bacterium]|nr:hypothetical protein [bacterium]
MDRKSLLLKDLRHSWHPYTQMSTLATEPPMLIDRAEGLFLSTRGGTGTTTRSRAGGASSTGTGTRGSGRP